MGLVTGPHARNHVPEKQTAPATRAHHVGVHDTEPGRETQGPSHPPLTRHAEHWIRAGNAEGQGPPETNLPAPCIGTARTARPTPTNEGSTHSAGGQAHTHTNNGHAACTKRAIGPSSGDAKTALDGVPACEGKQHPDGTARNTHREGGEERGGKGGRKREPAPAPSPQTCRERCTHTNRALHPRRQ